MPIKSRKHSSPSLSPLTAGATATALVTGLALSCPIAATAQSAPAARSDSSHSLSTVNVVGQDNSYKTEQLSSPKFTQPLVDTTQTVTVIPQEVVRQQQATTLTEAMRNVPGAGTFFAGENGATSSGDAIYMRGINTANSIYVNGIRDISTVSRDMFNIDSIEVIKGPSGSDYGRSAPSGSINLVTKKPNLDDTLDASVGVGTADYFRSTVDWNHALSDTSAFRLNAVGMKAGVAGRDEVQNQRWGVAPSLAFGLNTPTTVYLDYVHVKQNNTPDGFVPTIGLPGFFTPGLQNAPRVDSRNWYGTAADHDNSTMDMATLRVEHKLTADTTIRNITRWGQTRQDYMATSFMFNPNSAPPSLQQPDPNNPATWTMNRSASMRDSVNRIITNQTNVTTKANTWGFKHDISAGLELTREEQRLFNHTSPTMPVVSIYFPNSDVFPTGSFGRNGTGSTGTTDTVALYAFDTVELTDRIQVNGGLRYDHYKTSFDASNICNNGTGNSAVPCGALPVGSAVPTSNTSTAGNLLDWKLGALYRLTKHGNVYANFAVSQQPPGGSNFSLASASGPDGGFNVAPSKAKTYEVGTKWELFNEKLLTNAALFRTEIGNQVVPLDDGVSFGQVGKQRIQGLELGAVGKITADWSVIGGYTFQDAKIVDGAAVTQDGSKLLSYTPKHAMSLWTTYRLPRGFTVGGGLRYVGGLAKGTDGAPGTPASTQAYWVADAMASYQVNRNLTLQLNIYNLFNKDYVAAINKSGYRYTPGIARSALLTANMSF
jgi:catecholate siderophore receptor